MSKFWSRAAMPAALLAMGIVIGVTSNRWSPHVLPNVAAADDKSAKAASDTADAKKADACCNADGKKAQRFGSVIGVKPEKLDEYIKLHANTWPGVLDRIRKSNIRNYSIYLGKLDDGNLYLFSYFEYVGDDFEGDMKKMAADPITQEWWKVTDPCQVPQKNRKPGSHWMEMKEVFHTD